MRRVGARGQGPIRPPCWRARYNSSKPLPTHNTNSPWSDLSCIAMARFKTCRSPRRTTQVAYWTHNVTLHNATHIEPVCVLCFCTKFGKKATHTKALCIRGANIELKGVNILAYRPLHGLLRLVMIRHVGFKQLHSHRKNVSRVSITCTATASVALLFLAQATNAQGSRSEGNADGGEALKHTLPTTSAGGAYVVTENGTVVVCCPTRAGGVPHRERIKQIASGCGLNDSAGQNSGVPTRRAARHRDAPRKTPWCRCPLVE